MPPETPVKKVFDKPSHPDDQKYQFNCCASPDVWHYSDDEIRCRVCGDSWTDKLQSD